MRGGLLCALVSVALLPAECGRARLDVGPRSSTSVPHRYIVWFRKDLRVHDHPVLSEVSAKRTLKEVVPVYIFDERLFGTSDFGSRKMSPVRQRFLIDAVVDLRRQLRLLGSDLLVGIGLPELLIPRLVARLAERALPVDAETRHKLLSSHAEATTILWHEAVGAEELAVDAALLASLPPGVATGTRWSGTLWEKWALPFEGDLSDMPQTFDHWRPLVEGFVMWQSAAAELLPKPREGTLPLPTGERVFTCALVSPPSGHTVLIKPTWHTHGPCHTAHATRPCVPHAHTDSFCSQVSCADWHSLPRCVSTWVGS